MAEKNVGGVCLFVGKAEVYPSVEVREIRVDVFHRQHQNILIVYVLFRQHPAEVVRSQLKMCLFRENIPGAQALMVQNVKNGFIIFDSPIKASLNNTHMCWRKIWRYDKLIGEEIIESIRLQEHIICINIESSEIVDCFKANQIRNQRQLVIGTVLIKLKQALYGLICIWEVLQCDIVFGPEHVVVLRQILPQTIYQDSFEFRNLTSEPDLMSNLRHYILHSLLALFDPFELFPIVQRNRFMERQPFTHPLILNPFTKIKYSILFIVLVAITPWISVPISHYANIFGTFSIPRSINDLIYLEEQISIYILIATTIILEDLVHGNQRDLSFVVIAIDVVQLEVRKKEVAFNTEHSKMIKNMSIDLLVICLSLSLHLFTSIHLELIELSRFTLRYSKENSVYILRLDLMLYLLEISRHSKLLIMIQEDSNIFGVAKFSQCSLKIKPLHFRTIYDLNSFSEGIFKIILLF